MSPARRTRVLIINTDEQTGAWLKLLHCSGLGAVKIAALLEQFHSAAAILDAGRSALSAAGLSRTIIDALYSDAKNAQIQACQAWAKSAANRHIICRDDARYPPQLLETPRPPCVLFVAGDASILADPQIAMVGSRSASKYGQDCAYDFAKYLSAKGIIVTSGLALGIDGCSHRGALAAGSPTIAVVATGLDRVYPRQHRDLAHQIINQGGALVSEFTIGTNADGRHFPQRNRIIAGLSVATLVVEAALKSGSLITANCAREINRDVFAIPNSIHSTNSKGCHFLIKEGAKLVETGEDVITELQVELQAALNRASEVSATSAPIDLENQSAPAPAIPEPPAKPTAAPLASAPADLSALSAVQQQLLAALEYDLLSIDELGNRTQLPAGEIAAAMLILELEGYVYGEAGGRYQRTAK